MTEGTIVRRNSGIQAATMLRSISALACAALLGMEAAAQRPKPAAVPRGSSSAPASQSPTVGPRDPYAAEPAVFERFDTAYRFRADGTGSKVDTAAVRVQGEAALRGLSILSIPYVAGTERIEFVSVRVRKPNGTTVDTPVAEVQDQPTRMTQATPLYSDTHLALLPVRGLALGDRLEYQVRTVFTAAEAKDQFWGTEGFGRGRVVVERSVELRVPAAKYLQVICPRYPAKVSDEGDERVYRWSGSQTRLTVQERARGQAGADRSEEEEPDEVAPAIQWTTFRSWAEVGEWYQGLSANGMAPTPALQAKADQVLFGLPSTNARITALYAYVSREVGSIDAPLGQGSWQPHTATEVLNNQFGDSKDKSLLLAAMLRAEHLTASVALVPANREVDPTMPTPSWFSRAVTVASDPPRADLWLDPLSEVAPAGFLDSSLRDEMALVIPATGTAELRRTPRELPFAAEDRFEASGALTASGALKAHVDLHLRGDEEMALRQSLHTLGPAQWDRLSQNLVQADGLRGQTSNTAAEAPEATDRPLHMSFDLSGTSYGDWENFRIVSSEPALRFPFTERRSSPGREVVLGGRRTEVAISRLTLPAGFSADLPPAVHVQTAFADLEKTYRLETAGSSVTLLTQRTLTVKGTKVPVGEWTAYRKFLDEVGESEPWVQLTSAEASGNHHPPAPGEDSPKAAELVRQAGEAIDRKDWPTATSRLDGAKELSARQPFLWSSYGALAQGLGKPAEAIEDDRRELKEHPEEASVSHRLASALGAGGKTAEATDVLKAALALNPRDERTIDMLGSLQATTDAPAAEKTFRAGLAILPDSLHLKLALGNVTLREGKRDEAAALLMAVATESQDAGELNDAAYALGDAGLHLPTAEAAARQAIQMLNAASVRGEGRGNSEAELRQSGALISAWDTYGWVLFKEGLTSEAEPWLRAAWADGFGTEPGRHLALLLGKQGQAAEASAVQRAVAQGSPAATGGNVRSGAGNPHARGTASATGERAAGGVRVFPLQQPAGGKPGTAVFQLESSLGSADEAHFLRGDEALAGMEAAVARVNTHPSIPPGTPIHLFRRGVLRCGAGTTCTLEVLSLQAALAQ